MCGDPPRVSDINNFYHAWATWPRRHIHSIARMALTIKGSAVTAIINVAAIYAKTAEAKSRKNNKQLPCLAGLQTHHQLPSATDVLKRLFLCCSAMMKKCRQCTHRHRFPFLYLASRTSAVLRIPDSASSHFTHLA